MVIFDKCDRSKLFAKLIDDENGLKQSLLIGVENIPSHSSIAK